MLPAPRRAALAGLVLLAMLAAGCAKGSDSISNSPNAFRYSGQWQGFSGTKEYDWVNHRGGAEVRLSGDATQGSVGITLRDAAGTEVLQAQPLQPGVRPVSQAGQPGTWRITLTFQGFHGDITVNVVATEGRAAPSA